MIRGYLSGRRREERFRSIREAHIRFDPSGGEERLADAVSDALCGPEGFRFASVGEIRPDGSIRLLGSAAAPGESAPGELPLPPGDREGRRTAPARTSDGRGAVVSVPAFVDGEPRLLLSLGSRDASALEGEELEDIRALAARIGEAVGAIRTRNRLVALREGYDRIASGLEYQSELFRRVLDLVDVPVVRLGPEGEIRMANRRLESLSGYSASEILNRRMADLLLPEDARSPFRRLLVELFIGKRHSGSRFPLVSREGAPIEIDWDFDAVRGEDGKVSTVLASGRPIATNVS